MRSRIKSDLCQWYDIWVFSYFHMALSPLLALIVFSSLTYPSPCSPPTALSLLLSLSLPWFLVRQSAIFLCFGMVRTKLVCTHSKHTFDAIPAVRKPPHVFFLLRINCSHFQCSASMVVWCLCVLRSQVRVAHSEKVIDRITKQKRQAQAQSRRISPKCCFIGPTTINWWYEYTCAHDGSIVQGPHAQ